MVDTSSEHQPYASIEFTASSSREALQAAARAFVEGHPASLAGAGCDGGAVDKRECLTLAFADRAAAMQRAARDRTESPPG